MDIGIGFPHAAPGESGGFILDWARRAEEGPFSSISVIDRLVYPNHDPLIVLSAAAAVTPPTEPLAAMKPLELIPAAPLTPQPTPTPIPRPIPQQVQPTSRLPVQLSPIQPPTKP